MTDEGYDGWTNYETWALHMHITNTDMSNSYWTEQARKHLTFEVADELKE